MHKYHFTPPPPLAWARQYPSAVIAFKSVDCRDHTTETDEFTKIFLCCVRHPVNCTVQKNEVNRKENYVSVIQ